MVTILTFYNKSIITTNLA